MKYRYFYRGTTTVNIPYLGTFEPNKEYEVEKPINHPDFEEVRSASPAGREEIRKKGK